jgi:hypothetical protein
MSIKDIGEKIKGTLRLLERKEVYTLCIIILVGFASFGLGRLSVLEGKHVPIRIEYPQGSENTTSAVPPSKQPAATAASLSSGSVVASKNGIKYYFPWCGGVSRISEANKKVFASVEAAEKAGYSPAANCKGL